MSKGPGRIQRAISAAFEAEPNNAFTTIELCERAYPHEVDPDLGDLVWEKKHRVAVVRAAKKIRKLDHMQSETLGGQLVFYDRFNVMSYGMARLKADNLNSYRNKDPRCRWRQDTEADLRAMLADENHRKLVAKGGAWWLHTERAKARARGDKKREAQIQKQIDRDWDKAVGATRAALARISKR